MHFFGWENRVFSVHEFVHEHSEGVGIVGVDLGFRVALEFWVVEVWDVCLFLELEDEVGVDGNWLADLGNAILNVDVFDMQHAETLDG